MKDFMENGNGEYKTKITKHEEKIIVKVLVEKGFKKEEDFHIALYSGLSERVFYNEKCMNKFKRIC